MNIRKLPHVCGLLLLLVLFANGNKVSAQSARYFRITGPAATAVTAIQPNGTIVWSNAQPGSIFGVQTSSDLKGSNWVDYVQLPTTNAVNTNHIFDLNPPSGMALIPAGIFTMGDTLDHEADAVPTNTVVSEIYMDVNLVTLAQWQTVAAWATNHGYAFDNPGNGKTSNHPVNSLNWWDMVKWCNARSEMAGLVPCYHNRSVQGAVYRTGQHDMTNSEVDWTANGYRLPTEAEWEKAARGGLIGKRYPWGNQISQSMAGYTGDTNDFHYDLGPNGANPGLTNGGFPYTNPGGFFPANGYGLYDMAGNELEWLWDIYSTPYAGGTDPRGPDALIETQRIVRGGNWTKTADWERCAYRIAYLTSDVSPQIGFRCVRRTN